MLETSSPESGALAPGSVETARKPYPPPALTSAGASTGEAVACVEGAGSSGTATGITSASSACEGAGSCGAAVACISFGASGAVEALATASSALGTATGSAAAVAAAESGVVTDASICCSPTAAGASGAIASGGAVRYQFLSPQRSHALQPLSRICLRETTVSVAV